ncbi:MAG: hypothetical protein HUJ63_13065 [Enterococcus sp.]|nr:hypothetical protein [Enterococcus sp.]
MTNRTKEEAAVALESMRIRDRERRAQDLQSILVEAATGRMPGQPFGYNPSYRTKEQRRASREAKKMRPVVRRNIDGSTEVRVRGQVVQRTDRRGRVVFDAFRNGSPSRIAAVFGIPLVAGFGDDAGGSRPARRVRYDPGPDVGYTPERGASGYAGVSRPVFVGRRSTASGADGGGAEEATDTSTTAPAGGGTDGTNEGRDEIALDLGSVKYTKDGKQVFDYYAGLSEEERDTVRMLRSPDRFDRMWLGTEPPDGARRVRIASPVDGEVEAAAKGGRAGRLKEMRRMRRWNTA